MQKLVIYLLERWWEMALRHKIYYQTHREQVLTSSKRWKQNHPDKVREMNKRYYYKHHKQINDYHAKYTKEIYHKTKDKLLNMSDEEFLNWAFPDRMIK